MNYELDVFIYKILIARTESTVHSPTFVRDEGNCILVNTVADASTKGFDFPFVFLFVHFSAQHERHVLQRKESSV